jgi:hypothetical protein
MSTRPSFRLTAATLALVASAVSALAGQSDPFSMPVRKKPARAAAAPPRALEIPAPPFSDRAAQCRARAGGGVSVESSPCPYLVSELSIVGVFSTAEGEGAFVQAKVSNQTFVIKPGDALFDGKVVSIRPATVSTPAAVVFAQTRRVRTRNVVREMTTNVTLEQGR